MGLIFFTFFVYRATSSVKFLLTIISHTCWVYIASPVVTFSFHRCHTMPYLVFLGFS